MPKKGYRQSSQHRENERIAQTGLKSSPEARANMSLAAVNRPQISPETSKKMSEAGRGNQNSKGYEHSQETCDKMSASQMGHSVSPETCAKISATKKRRGQGHLRNVGYVSAPHRKLFWALLMATNPEYEVHIEYPVKTVNTTRFIDIAFPDQKLAVEYDGEHWHPEKDLGRDKELTDLGWMIIHVQGSKIWYTAIGA